MADRSDCNPPKKRKVSLSLKRRKKEGAEDRRKKEGGKDRRRKEGGEDSERFVAVSKEALEDLSIYKMPKNSALNSQWAMRNLRDWVENYNTRNSDDPCPLDILSPQCSKEILAKWMCVYVSETRNKTGEPYSPKTLYSLICGILREMRVKNPNYPNFLEKSDPDFRPFLTTLDNIMKSLRSEGIGSTSSQTEGITKEEQILWTSGVMNTKDPRGLLRAVFYYCGKCFCLRGGQEHCNLSLLQLERHYDRDRYTYREYASKNKQGGLRQMRIDHKVVSIVANVDAGEKCPVFLLDMYISKLPAAAKEKNFFYCRPLQSVPTNELDPWYAPVPIGRNLLQTMVRKMCEEAGICGHKTNHSLRVSGTTSLFEAGVPEHIIQGRSGHSSLEALRKYERVSVEQQKEVSRILTGVKDNYEPEVQSYKCPVEESDVNLSKSSTQSSTVTYKDCVVNMYSASPPYSYYPPYGHFPFYPFC